MEKKNKQNLLMVIIFIIIVSMTLFFMYDNFSFQTYSEVVYYDYMLNGENDDFKVENIEIYYNQNNFYIGEGKVVLKNNSYIEASIVPVVEIKVRNNKQKFESKLELTNYSDVDNSYSIKKIFKNKKKIKLNKVEAVELVISGDNINSSKLNLDITPLQQLEGSNKDYRIENASISNQMMRLGSLKTSNEDIIQQYPNVSLEYRYIKDPKKNKDDNENYIVFKKISGKSKELVNGDDYGNYYIDDGDFRNKDLSVVIIFSDEDNKFAFAIELINSRVGEYYE